MQQNLPLFCILIVFCLGVLGFFFSLRGLSGARSITQKPRFTLKQTAVGTLSKLIKVWFEFPRVCMCLCTHTYACNLFFSLYLLAHSEGVLLQLIPHGPQRWESSHLVPCCLNIFHYDPRIQPTQKLLSIPGYLQDWRKLQLPGVSVGGLSMLLTELPVWEGRLLHV